MRELGTGNVVAEIAIASDLSAIVYITRETRCDRASTGMGYESSHQAQCKSEVHSGTKHNPWEYRALNKGI